MYDFIFIHLWEQAILVWFLSKLGYKLSKSNTILAILLFTINNYAAFTLTMHFKIVNLIVISSLIIMHFYKKQFSEYKENTLKNNMFKLLKSFKLILLWLLFVLIFDTMVLISCTAIQPNIELISLSPLAYLLRMLVLTILPTKKGGIQ